MNSPMPIPHIGTRFSFHGAQFEVSFVGHGMCRYSAIAGGNTCQITYSQFEEWYQSGEIKYEFYADGLILDSQKLSTITRKFRYVQAALTELACPTAIDPLAAIIIKVSHEISDLSPPSPRTVARWIYSYRIHNDHAELIEKKRPGNRYLRFSPEIEQLIFQGIHEVYLRPERRDCKDVLAFIVGKMMQRGLTTYKRPNLKTIQRRVQKLDPIVVARAKKGARFAKKLAKAAGMAIISPNVMALVEIDTHTLDIIVIDPATGAILGRPFLACAIDVYTRAIIGTYISLYPPSALTTLAVIKDMITRPNRGLPGGVPAQIIPDNGVEFKNSSFSRFCEALAITITPSQVKTPDDKPHIERFFGTLTRGVIQKHVGTTFSNPNERGDYDSYKHARMTLEEITSAIDWWINEVYHTAIHSETGRAPILAWEDATQSIKPLSLTIDDANVLCRQPFTRTIQQGCVQINGLHYYSHALCTLELQKISKVTVLIDELDLSHVFVIHPSQKNTVILAESTEPEYTSGLTSYAHQEAQKIKQELTRSDLHRLGPHANLLARWHLLKKIQNDLQKKKPKLRKLVIDIPQELQKLSISVKPQRVVKEVAPEETQSSHQAPSFASMEI